MNYYNEIKNELIENETINKVKDYSKNKSDLTHYYNVGRLLIDAGKHYGEGIINNYSIRLTNEVDKKYNTTNLKRMRQFYLIIEKGATMRHQLSWSHYRELIPLKDVNKINYYVNECIKRNLSQRELHFIIKHKEYERLDDKTILKLINQEKVEINDFVKNPIIIKNNLDIIAVSEKYLKMLILEDLDSFLKELGEGFLYVGNEYKIKIGNTFNYIDILLFNYKFNCFVVTELKVTELKKEHIGQIQVYMNYVDKFIKEIYHDKTIGIIICKKDNKLVLEYSSDPRIFSTTYDIVNTC